MVPIALASSAWVIPARVRAAASMKPTSDLVTAAIISSWLYLYDSSELIGASDSQAAGIPLPEAISCRAFRWRPKRRLPSLVRESQVRGRLPTKPFLTFT